MTSRDGNNLVGGRGAVKHVRGRRTREARETVQELEAALEDRWLLRVQFHSESLKNIFKKGLLDHD